MYYRRKLFTYEDDAVADFQSFVSPEAFILPSQYADYGLTVDLYSTYHAYSNPNKKLIYEFTSEINTLVLPAITGVSYRWAETIGGVDYITDIASGTAFTAGSTKRYVIFNSTVAIYSLLTNQPVGIIWLYVGKNTSMFVNNSNLYLKYVFLEDEKSITRCPAIDNCQNATGTLTIPNTLTNKAIGSYAFRSTNSINKVIIPESITDLDYASFSGTAAIVGRHYYIYCMVAPIASGSFSKRPAILHIKAGATGFDVAPWNDTAYFSQIIQDL